MQNELGYFMYNEPEKLFGLDASGMYDLKKSFGNKVTAEEQESAFMEHVPMPDLLQPTIDKHLEHIAMLVKGKQIDLVDQFCSGELQFDESSIEEAIQDFELFGEEWCQYNYLEKEWKSIDKLPPGAKVYDTETYVLGGSYPILGVALDNENLYIWSPVDLDPQGVLISVGEDQVLIGHNCLPLDTEVLTPKGWVRLTEVKPGDTVLSHNGQNQEWCKVLEYVDGGFQELIEFSTTRYRFSSTRGHRWLGLKRGESELSYLTTEEITQGSGKRFKILTTDDTVGFPETSPITEDEAYLLGMAYGDGTLRPSFITITQKKPEKVAKIGNTLARTGLRYKFYNYGEVYRWRIYCDFHLEDLFTTLSTSSRSVIESWASGVWDAEGLLSRDKFAVTYQTDARPRNTLVKDAFQFAMQLLGRRTWQNLKEECVLSSENKFITNRTTKITSLGVHPVACLRTENSNFVIRQNGFVTLTGNCGYDLGRTYEAYTLKEHKIDWVDTQSMHIICNGLADGQRAYFALKESLAKGKHLSKNDYFWVKSRPKWSRQGSTNSLAATYDFHVGGKMDKELRNIFVTGSLDEIIDGIVEGDLLRYAVLDVLYTSRLAKVLWGKLKYHKPSKVSLAGLMLRMDGRIPLPQNWKQWVQGCDAKYAELEQEACDIIKAKADDLMAQFKEDPDFWKDDFWYMQLDWEVKPKARGKYKGIPQWYRPFVKDPNYKPTTRNIFTHHLMKLTWEGSPLIFDKKKKWCYTEKSGKVSKVPHNKTPGANVGILICKDYKWALEAEILKSEGGTEAKRLFDIAKAQSYWTSVQSRVKGKFVVKEDGVNLTVGEPVPWGTVSGRVVESLFLTLCSTKKDKVGTELKTRFEAPDGWSIVGFDFDQQEVRIASLLADNFKGGILGSTPISKQVYTGSKDKGTDSHSALASKLGVTRDNAKPLNFLMQYSGGKKSLADKLQQNNKTWSRKKCEQVATKALEVHKGTKCYTQNGQPYYKDGIASEMFNYMERAVSKAEPQLPFLKTRISRALWTTYCGRDYMTGRTNWLIQASGSEILDATLVCVKYLAQAYNIDCRFILSIHDEAWFMAPEEQKLKLAAILQVAHAWVWAGFNYSLGMPKMLLCGMWASGIAVDNRVRKSVKESTTNISHNGDHEPNGKEYTIEELFATGVFQELFG